MDSFIARQHWFSAEGSATEQNGVQDFKISRFHEISGFLWDFNNSQRILDLVDFKISYRFQDLIIDFKILMRFHRISRGSHSILIKFSVFYIRKNIAWDFRSRISVQISASVSKISACCGPLIQRPLVHDQLIRKPVRNTLLEVCTVFCNNNKPHDLRKIRLIIFTSVMFCKSESC